MLPWKSRTRYQTFAKCLPTFVWCQSNENPTCGDSFIDHFCAVVNDVKLRYFRGHSMIITRQLPWCCIWQRNELRTSNGPKWYSVRRCLWTSNSSALRNPNDNCDSGKPYLFGLKNVGKTVVSCDVHRVDHWECVLWGEKLDGMQQNTLWGVVRSGLGLHSARMSYPQRVIIFGCWMCCDQNAMSGDGIWKRQRRFMIFVCHQHKLHEFRYLNVSLFSN